MKASEPAFRTVITGWGVCLDVLRRHLHRSRAAVVAISMGSVLFSCASSSVPTGEAFVAPQSVTQIKGRYFPIDSSGTAEEESISGEMDERAVGNYRLGPGDTMTVFIQGVPNGTFDVAVRPDGYISLPIIDEVRVAGLTPALLDDQLTELYSGRFVDPELSVIVRSLRQPMVYIMGKVALPGPVLFNQASSAAEAIARAGDMLPIADVSNVTIIRLGDDGVIRSMALKTDDNNSAFRYQAGPYMALAATQLEPEDIVFVPERGVARLGTNLQQLLGPVTAVGGAISAVLSPWLFWEILDDLTNAENGSAGVGVNIQ